MHRKKVEAPKRATSVQIHAEMLRLIASAIEQNRPEILREMADTLEKTIV